MELGVLASKSGSDHVILEWPTIGVRHLSHDLQILFLM